MKKKLSLKSLEVKSFVTSVNNAAIKGGAAPDYPTKHCSEIDACVTAQICQTRILKVCL